MRTLEKRLQVLEAEQAPTTLYRSPVVVDVVGLSADEAAARIAAAEALAPSDVPVRMVVVDCPALREVSYESD